MDDYIADLQVMFVESKYCTERCDCFDATDHHIKTVGLSLGI